MGLGMMAGLLALAAQEAAPAPATLSDEIVVAAPGATYTLGARRLRAAQRAFAAHRPLAPGAALRFEVLPKGRPLDGIAFELRRGDTRVAVPIDARHDLVLPPLDSDDWELTANRRPGEVGLRAWVMSPGSSEADRRLGDLRLQCYVGWALGRDRFSFFQRTAFEAVDGCATRRFQIFTSATRPLAGAQAVEGGRALPLPIRDAIHYAAPIADRAFSDEARVRLAFRQP